MAKEIERKFLVRDLDLVKAMASARSEIRQTYISTLPESTVRVRTRDSKAFLTIKGKNTGASRDEWEYEIPLKDALDMARTLCGGFAIEKIRYIVPFGGLNWEVDEFRGRHAGLIVAEIELPTEEFLLDSLPPFIGREVTGDPAYYNSTLSLQS